MQEWLVDARRVVDAARELGLGDLDGAPLPVALGALFAAVQHQVSLLPKDAESVFMDSYHATRAHVSGEPCACGSH